MIGGSSNPALKVYAVAAVVVLYAPLAVLVAFSFNDSLIIAFPFKGWTLEWYRRVIGDEPLLTALGNSLWVAAAASLASTILGIFGAKAVTRYRFPGRTSLAALLMLPLVVPEIVLSISLLALLLGLGSRASLFNVVIGHVVFCSPYALATLTSRFSGLDPSLEEAARDLGEGPWTTFLRVTLPLILPGILSSLLLCFLMSFDEFLLAFFLSGPDATLPVYLYAQLRFPQKLTEMLALGVMMIATSIVVVVAAELLHGSRVPTEG